MFNNSKKMKSGSFIVGISVGIDGIKYLNFSNDDVVKTHTFSKKINFIGFISETET